MKSLKPLSLPPIIGVTVKPVRKKRAFTLTPCKQCKTIIPANDLCESHYRRQVYCTMACKNVAARKEVVKHYRGMTTPDKRVVHVHRYVMEQHLGRRLRTDEHVHHKDENIFNNALENLELLSCAEHTRRHNLKRPLTAICTWCKNPFATKTANFKTCSRQCGHAQSTEKTRKLSISAVVCIIELGLRGNVFHTDIGTQYGVSQGAVSKYIREYKAQ